MTKPKYPKNPYPAKLAEGRTMFICDMCKRRYPARYAYGIAYYLFCPFCLPSSDDFDYRSVLRERKELRRICDGEEGKAKLEAEK